MDLAQSQYCGREEFDKLLESESSSPPRSVLQRPNNHQNPDGRHHRNLRAKINLKRGQEYIQASERREAHNTIIKALTDPKVIPFHHSKFDPKSAPDIGDPTRYAKPTGIKAIPTRFLNDTHGKCEIQGTEGEERTRHPRLPFRDLGPRGRRRRSLERGYQ